MNAVRNSILAGLLFGIFLGVFLAFLFGVEQGIITGIISGLFFGIAIYFFVTSDVIKKQTGIEVGDGREIIHSGGANHFKNTEAVGGKLYLLSDKLRFQSHKLNIQNHILEIRIKQIDQVHFFNMLGFIPNGLKIQTKDGGIEKFVVSDRKIWKGKIEELIRKG